MPDLRRPILAIFFCVVVAVQVRWAMSTIERLVRPPHDPELINAVDSSLVLPGQQAAKVAGANPKDRIVAFDSRPVAQRTDLYREVMDTPLGLTTLTLARGAERIVVPYKVKSLSDSSGNFLGGTLTIVLNILMPTLCILLGFFVAWQRPEKLSAWMLLLTLLGWSQTVHSNFWMHWGWDEGLRTAGTQTIRDLRLLAPAADLATLRTLSTELLLPLAAQHRLLGILSLGPKRSEEPYSGSDLRLLESVANHTGLALENSRLTRAVAQEAAQRERIHREIEIAREVQERLLPRGGPRIEGLDYAGHCRPALTIGGDYFDYIQTPSGEIGFALGDIAGKGVPAALLMASLQASLRGLSAGGVGDLRELMAKLNTLVYDATPKNRFATFVYALYHAQTRQMRLCSAGHNASLLLSAHGSVEWIRPPGIALGLTRQAAYEQVEFTLAPGDRLILYTDGITEARDATGDDYGEARLAELATGFGDLPSAYSLTALIADVDRFAGDTPQHDDLTALILRAV